MAYPEDFDDIVICGKADLLACPPRDQVALCLHRLESEVNNGGFHQFFLNSSGQIVPETLKALTEVGAVRTRQLLERAIAVAYPNGYPPRLEDLEGALADFDHVADDLESLDAEFFKYSEPLADPVNAYLAKGT